MLRAGTDGTIPRESLIKASDSTPTSVVFPAGVREVVLARRMTLAAMGFERHAKVTRRAA
jgi:hypothetical protein